MELEIPTAEAFAQEVITALVGDVNDGRLQVSLTEQIEAQVKTSMGSLNIEAQLSEIRESLASRPPTGAEAKISLPPWATGMQLSQQIGIPDPNWHNPQAAGASEDDKWDNATDFLRAVIIAGTTGRRDDRLRFVSSGSKFSAELTGQEIELGGALVPEQFRPELMMMNLQPTSIRPRAMVIPMMAPTISIPAIRDESHRENVFGGVEFEFLEVNTQIPDTEPDFKLIELTARSLAGRTLIPNTLIQDSFSSVPALIYRLWGQAVPWIEEKHFLRGTGVGQPLGVLKSSAALVSDRNAADLIAWADVAEMESHLLPSSEGRAIWMAHPAAKSQIMQLRNGEVSAFQSSLNERMPSMLNGRPIVWNEHMSPRNENGQLALIDWTYYVIGDRQVLSMEASTHEKFSNYITVLRGIERFDGKPWLDTPLTLAQQLDSASTGTDFKCSPFVLLQGK